MSVAGISGVTGFSIASQMGASALNRQNLPGNTAAVSSASNTGFSNNIAASTAAHDSSNSALAEVKNYFKESPAQRMQDDWLSQHGITEAQFNSMSPADKQKIVDQMRQDIQAKMKQKLGSANGASAGTVGAAAVSLLA